MPVIKISGMDSVLADPGVEASLGFNTANMFMQFLLYKGALPTRVEISAATNINSFRASDLLYSVQLVDQTRPSMGLAGANSAYVQAVASGQAGWFMLCGVNASGVMSGAVAGDVSDTTGNGQLQLQTVSITQGWMYRVPKLTSIFPYSFAY